MADPNLPPSPRPRRVLHSEPKLRPGKVGASLHPSDNANALEWRPSIDSNHRRSLSEYAVNIGQTRRTNEWQIKDDDSEFFEIGRDYQPRKQKHHFTQEEKEIMATYEGTPWRPSHTAVYRHWLASLPPRRDTESWIIIALVAIIIGILTFAMKSITERFQIFYNPFITTFVQGGKMFKLWIYYAGISCTCGALSAVIIIYLSPQAGGSGIPEVIGILNSVVVRNVLTVKTLICKIISCMFTVISGLPVGFEGPLIHIGAMVAALMARPCRCYSCWENIYLEDPSESEKTNCCSKKFRKICTYRDCQERHNLICVGAAAAFSSAFSSPITGLSFAMEELSTHWTVGLTWQTFVCCILSRSTSELLHSLSQSIESHENGEKVSSLFDLSESALFGRRVRLKLNLLVFIPAALIGILGGLLGSLYIFMHLKMARFRRRILTRIKRTWISNVFRILEVVLLCFICSSLVMLSMPLFYCNPVNHTEPISTDFDRHTILRSLSCDRDLKYVVDKEKLVVSYEGQFHEGASLLFGSWEQMIRNLLSRRSTDFFGIPCLSLILFFFFIFSSWAAMVSAASGLLIPQLAIGTLYGRLLGKCLNDMFKEFIDPNGGNHNWDLIDPGGLALLGAAAFFAGTSRLPITSVVMIAELTDDISFSLLVMIAVMLAKFVGDRFTHSLFHSLLEFKCIPFLEPELKIYHNNMRVDLELFPISIIMTSPVSYVYIRSSVYRLANLLLDTNHGAFPVVKTVDGTHSRSVFIGLISRMELTILLTKTEGFDISELKKEDVDKIRITYPEFTSTKLKDCAVTNRILQMYSTDDRYKGILVNLYPYINLSAHVISASFSLQRGYILFRDLGIRHLVVVDENNGIQGIITRKDLLGFAVEEKVKEEIKRIKDINKASTNGFQTVTDLLTKTFPK